ncbi:hypothetical protein TSIB_1829 [Thermococcus sibiricus MM 739]|uniref:Uncharacterized protein n=1 Tax=Thermococcus sibiricus (strain DSM 12597 / MM 739) TaxID=604354 RepID=C6A5I5_THESM|nr:hypothetical protein TSIB_1829 [Thermococcus sibiricus MM 739]
MMDIRNKAKLLQEQALREGINSKESNIFLIVVSLNFDHSLSIA